MRVEDLIDRLRALPPGSKVMILDGFNGGGFPRDINLFGDRQISGEDADECCDCEGKVGETVSLLGFGSY